MTTETERDAPDQWRPSNDPETEAGNRGEAAQAERDSAVSNAYIDDVEAGLVNPLLVPDPRPENEAIRQEYLRLQAAADAAFEASSGGGDKAYEGAARAARLGWDRYVAAWDGAAPETELEAGS